MTFLIFQVVIATSLIGFGALLAKNVESATETQKNTVPEFNLVHTKNFSTNKLIFHYNLKF